MSSELSREVTRIAHNMAVVPGYHGVVSVEAADELLERFGDTLFCNGYLRRIVLTPITKKNFSFKTVPA